MTDEDREMRRRNARDNYQRHREARRKYAREYYHRNNERIKRNSQAWRERNPEKVRRSLRAYAERNPEVIVAIKKRYYERTRETRLQRMREYDERRGPRYGRKVRRAGFTHLVNQVVERAGGRCERCGVTGTRERGKNKLHLHYIDGDDKNNVLENLTLICASCHMRARVCAAYCQKNHETGQNSIVISKYTFKSCARTFSKMVSKTVFCPILSY